jgi:hypothetical protein
MRAIREHVAVRIELRRDDGDILGMVTLFDEKEGVVFTDVTDIVHRLARHRRTGEHVVQRYELHQHQSCEQASHGHRRPSHRWHQCPRRSRRHKQYR